jgi:hypothetical protein
MFVNIAVSEKYTENQMESFKCFKQYKSLCLKISLLTKPKWSYFALVFFVLHRLWKEESSVSIRLFSTMFYVLVFTINFLKPNNFFPSGSPDFNLRTTCPLSHFIKFRGCKVWWVVNSLAFGCFCHLIGWLCPQECGSDRCRWRPDCAAYCPASRWPHAKRRLIVLFLIENLCFC